MRPRVFLPSEHRHKSGEVVVGRSDVSATVLYFRQGPPGRGETLVALVREFRSAVRNRSGYGYMLPGGSTAQATEREQDARATALKEVAEETGLRVIRWGGLLYDIEASAPDLGWNLAASVAPMGERASIQNTIDATVAAAVARARPGDVLLVMSNGGFGGIHGKLLDALAR